MRIYGCHADLWITDEARIRDPHYLREIGVIRIALIALLYHKTALFWGRLYTPSQAFFVIKAQMGILDKNKNMTPDSVPLFQNLG